MFFELTVCYLLSAEKQQTLKIYYIQPLSTNIYNYSTIYRCGHCKRLAPTWAELGDAFASNDKVEIASVDCTVHKDTCSKADIKGYPTLKVYFNGQEQEKYAGQRALTQLKEFVEAQVKKLTEETTA